MKLHILAAALVALGLAGAKKTPAKKSAAPAAPARPELSREQLDLAQRIHTGKIACSGGQSVTITPDDKNPGYFRVTSGKQNYAMHPVPTSTGAMRLEDPKAGAVWLQLGNKSMLMNQKLGQRIADGCANDEQRAFAAELDKQPARPSLFDAPPPAASEK